MACPAFFGDDLEIGLPHVTADEPQGRARDIVKSCGSVEHGSGGFLPILFVCTAFCLDTIDELHTSTHQR
jgi:hypothetical protein